MPSRAKGLKVGLAATFALLAVGAGALTIEYRLEQQEIRDRAHALTGGDPSRGEALFRGYGCGGCHKVTGVAMAAGQVGPPLDEIGARAILAGRLANKPENLMRWVRDPRGVDPQTAMPDLGVTTRDARDIAAFLYTLG